MVTPICQPVPGENKQGGTNISVVEEGEEKQHREDGEVDGRKDCTYMVRLIIIARLLTLVYIVK
jgi:hypothetical protein